jgi:hypothetical protein
VTVSIPKAAAKTASLEFRLEHRKLHQLRRREGRCLLCTNVRTQQPETLWPFYIRLTAAPGSMGHRVSFA